MKRFRELDGLRGIASVAVVLSHFSGSFDDRYPGFEPSPFDAWWGAYGVQLFFLISGFVIFFSATRAKKSKDFVISRVSRLYPTYWVALILALILTSVFAIPQTQISWWQKLANFSMVQRWFLIPNLDLVYWTLAIEMQFYVMIFLLILFSKCDIRPKVVTVLCLVWMGVSIVVAVALAPYSHGVVPNRVAQMPKLILNVTLAEWAPLFSAGMFAFLAKTDRRYVKFTIGSGLVAILVAGVLHSVVDAACVAIVFTVFSITIFRQQCKMLLLRPVQFFGRISYSLYVSHFFAGVVTISLLAPFIGRIPAMVVAFIVVVLIAWALHSVAEVRLSKMMKNWMIKSFG